MVASARVSLPAAAVAVAGLLLGLAGADLAGRPAR